MAEACTQEFSLSLIHISEAGGLLLQKRLKAKNLKQLRKVPAMDIVKNTDFESFWPNVDGYSITDDQYKLYETGSYNDVNVIIGTNSDEGSMFSRPVSVSAVSYTHLSIPRMASSTSLFSSTLST